MSADPNSPDRARIPSREDRSRYPSPRSHGNVDTFRGPGSTRPSPKHTTGSGQCLPASGSHRGGNVNLTQSPQQARSGSKTDLRARSVSSTLLSPVVPTSRVRPPADIQVIRSNIPIPSIPATGPPPQVTVSHLPDGFPPEGLTANLENPLIPALYAAPNQQYASYGQHLQSPEPDDDSIRPFRAYPTSNSSSQESGFPNSTSPSPSIFPPPNTQNRPNTPTSRNEPVLVPFSTANSPLYLEKAHTSDDVPTPTPYDRDLTTRNICIVALVLGWGVSLAALTVGIYIILAGSVKAPAFLEDRLVAVGNVIYAWVRVPGIPNFYLADHLVYPVPQAAVTVISLLLNVALTLIHDCMNLIHATSLRWAHWRDGRSMCNSNLRLFSCSKHHFPNQWPANLISGIGAIVTYGGITLLTSHVVIMASVIAGGAPDFSSVTGPRYGIDFNAWGLIGIGSGLFLQAVICTFSLLYRRDIIATWSSNPLAVAKACHRSSLAHRNIDLSVLGARIEPSHSRMSSSQSGQALLRPHTGSSHHSRSEVPGTLDVPSAPSIPFLADSRPRTKQRSALSEIRHARRVANLVWLAFVTSCLFVIIVAIVAKFKFNSINTHNADDMVGRHDPLSQFRYIGQVNVPWYAGDPYNKRRDWLGLIAHSIILCPILANLHLVEFLTLLVRDEKIWRKATTRKGAKVHSSTIVQGASVWQCWMLFAVKSIVPWILSYGYSCDTGIFLNMIPLAVLAVIFLILALYAEALIRWEPKGSQPSTYGSIPALLRLVDDWDHKYLFWGHKSNISDLAGKAGTSGSRLADLTPNLLYAGLNTKVDP